MKRTKLLWITVLILGWLFDFLFWKHNTGLNFVLFALLVLAGGLLVLYLNGPRASWKSLLLLVPILFFATVTFLRREPLSSMLATVLTLALMGLLAVSYLGGRWHLYSLPDYVIHYARLALSMLARPIAFLVEHRKQAGGEPSPVNPANRSGWKRFFAILRGILIAIPILLVFTMLLSSADLVFARQVEDLSRLFRLEKLPEYILRVLFILAAAYALAGVFLHAGQQSRDEKLVGVEKPLVPAFLGFTEVTVVLGTVVVLFAFFAIVQFQYFFGGQTNISAQGFTYSDYARRGFGELVAVAFFSLLLFLGLSALVKRLNKTQRWVFSGLGVGMVALVGVMLVSAFQRLMLYETAYGFSRLRTYPHIFMVWLGLLLVAVVVFDILQKNRLFAFAALLATIGFVASLALVNVDSFIVRQNVSRAVAGESLDVAYLASLSSDSIPPLVERFTDTSLPGYTRDAAGAALACHQQISSPRQDPDWRSFSLSEWRAAQAFSRVQAQLDEYQVLDSDWPVKLLTPGNIYYECYQNTMGE